MMAAPEAANAPLWVQFVAPVLSFVGALFGAGIVALRFKRERAFDRRAEWYERAYAAMGRYMSLQMELRALYANPASPGAAYALVRERVEALTESSRITLDESLMFARPATRAAIIMASRKMVSTAWPTKYTASQPELQSVELVERSNALIAACVEAKRLIADEYREQLGLERLPTENFADDDE